MERLTEWNADHTHGAMVKHADGYTRLAEYEDSGLTPEEVAELSKIVRCKGCEHFRLVGGNTVNAPHNWCSHFRKYVAPNDFCSCGEKKGD